MEPMGAISEGEWGSLGEMYTNEEADFMAQLLSSCPGNPNEVNSVASFQGNSSSSCYWSSHEYSSIIQPNSVNENSPYYSFDIINNNTNSYYFSQGSGSNASNGNVLFPRNSSQESFRLSHSNPVLESNSNTGNNCMTPLMDICMADGTNTGSYLIEAGDDCSNRETSGGDANEGDQNQSGGIKYLELKSADEHDQKKALESNKNDHKLTIPFETTFRKRCRSTGDLQVKNKRNAKPKKNGKSSVSKNYEKDEDEDDAGVNVNRQTSSSCCSEDDYLKNPNEVETSSLSSKGKAVISLNCKARASRGSATDPQSLYARKRREGINERLRILQTLVPNGTKVDISTMLEEAVQYVKFLQLQIKLLSSDDLWMYAPIAYNGMNLGLDLKLTPPS